PSAVVLDPPEAGGARLGVVARLALAVTLLGFGRHHLDGEADVLGPVEGVRGSDVGAGLENDQVRLRALLGAELDAHLTADAIALRNGTAQTGLQQVDRRGVEV